MRKQNYIILRPSALVLKRRERKLEERENK
jgi:hypothetical protein